MFDIDQMILAPMMDAGVFGENVKPTYMPAGDGLSFTPPASFQIDGVFDDAFALVNLLDDGAPGFVTSNPVLGVRVAQFPAGAPPSAGDKMAIASTGNTYIVNEVKPDGHGWAKLELTLVGPTNPTWVDQFNAR